MAVLGNSVGKIHVSKPTEIEVPDENLAPAALEVDVQVELEEVDA